MKEICQRIKQLRQEHNLSMGRLAEIINVSPGNISDWESEKKKSTPTAKALVSIAEHFHVSLDWLMTGKEWRCNDPYVKGDHSSTLLQITGERTLEETDVQLLNDLANRLAKANRT